ncbi:competence/damage-inducible protein A [Paenibacillus radicis (ex Xue et al. 2023)]|uniref:Putative competence-damage inducible protein n=1 Tax=Paenibacillus radicis (ex Xue et al. 2023) TaxID=2972489 RepID=A0ABT1YC14_9BACL|nr:competence/damage-inducible protein A [Paenibacillus radicis (ex Xue et al. 2023)]MCR8630736.1 competence/damage-inducible protein A [Paenibacillus radicis (ex Xue et al. 2023)]
MKAEIIAVGTELLLGQILNTNAQFLAQSCADLGVSVYFQTVVGDNMSRLTEALQTAKSRADLIICTGGLGPTQDDLTKDALAAFLGRQIIMHQPSMDAIESMFSTRGIHMVESNRRQALMLEDSDPLINDAGLAVGIALTQDQTHYVLLPGPPKEMKPMFERYAAPWISAKMNHVHPLYSRMLKFAGIGESSLEHELLDLIEAQTDPSIAPYAKEGEVAIRLTTRAASVEEANLKLDPVELEIRSRLGQFVYASEDVTLEQEIVRILSARKQLLAAAESCTGGLFSNMLTSVPGSSAVYRGGIICYSNMLKHKLLNVPMNVLEGPGAPGAISGETAKLLAEQMLVQADSDYAVAITGVAGPDSSEGKPVGLVYVGIARKQGETVVEQLQLTGNRDSIKWRAAKSALYKLWKLL